MSKQDWAINTVNHHMQGNERNGYFLSPLQGVKLLQAERARARRIVRAYRKELHREWVKDEWDRELLCGVCDEILQRLG